MGRISQVGRCLAYARMNNKKIEQGELEINIQFKGRKKKEGVSASNINSNINREK